MENTQEKTQKEKNLQWHPAFFATTQIEFREESEYLQFENEHQLSTKPMAIDILVIKNEQNRKIQKNIGRIFRRYNLIEYKSPTDYISIDTFYKVYGYACFYKADTGGMNTIPIEEMTITLFGRTYPRKLIKHLKEVRGYRIKKQGDGIYYVEGDLIPIQIVVGNQLSPKENLWLSGLTNQLENQEVLEDLVRDYRKHSENTLYQSAMDIIVQANEEKFKEEEDMVICNALMEIIQDRVDEQVEDRVNEILQNPEELERRKKQFWERTEREIAEEVTEEVTKQVTEQVTEEVTKQVTEEVTEQVTKQVTKQVTEEVREQVTKQVTEEVREQVTKQVTEEVTEQVTKQVTEQVTKQAMEQGTRLCLKLAQLGRQDDIAKAMEDVEYRKKLLKELELE